MLDSTLLQKQNIFPVRFKVISINKDTGRDIGINLTILIKSLFLSAWSFKYWKLC